MESNLTKAALRLAEATDTLWATAASRPIAELGGRMRRAETEFNDALAAYRAAKAETAVPK